jgi:hypothetical protein
VILTITQDDLRIISKLLVEVYGPSQVIEEGVQEVELEKILLYLATNEAMKAADVNYRSVKAFQRSLIVEHVYHALVSPKLFREQQDEYINVFNVVKGFFSSPRGEKIYQRYGIPIVKANTMDVLKKEIEQSLNPDVERLFHHPKSLKVKFEKEITSRQEELSAQVLTANSIQLDENLEIEGEEEQEQEQEQENDVQEQVEPPSEEPYGKVLVRWSDHREKLFDGTLFESPTEFNQLITRNLEPQRMLPQAIAELNPVISLKDVLKAGNLEKYHHLFDARIHGSLNLFPIFQSTEEESQLFTPFGYYQGAIEFILISLNENGRVHSSTLITRDEALFVLGKWLVEDRDGKYSSHSKRPLLLYQFNNGFIRKTGNFLKNGEDGGFEEKKGEISTEPLDYLDEFFVDDQNRTDFLKLLVQAKFLSGATYFDGEEIPVLKSWLEEFGKDDFLDFFSNKVLEFKDSTRKDFELSVLYEILHAPSEAREGSRSNR